MIQRISFEQEIPSGRSQARNMSQTHPVLQAAASELHTALLRSDGLAEVFGGNFWGQCDVPALDDETSYTGIAVGLHHTVLEQGQLGSALYWGHCICCFFDRDVLCTPVTLLLSSQKCQGVPFSPISQD